MGSSAGIEKNPSEFVLDLIFAPIRMLILKEGALKFAGGFHKPEGFLPLFGGRHTFVDLDSFVFRYLQVITHIWNVYPRSERW